MRTSSLQADQGVRTGRDRATRLSQGAEILCHWAGQGAGLSSWRWPGSDYQGQGLAPVLLGSDAQDQNQGSGVDQVSRSRRPLQTRWACSHPSWEQEQGQALVPPHL